MDSAAYYGQNSYLQEFSKMGYRYAKCFNTPEVACIIQTEQLMNYNKYCKPLAELARMAKFCISDLFSVLVIPDPLRVAILLLGSGLKGRTVRRLDISILKILTKILSPPVFLQAHFSGSHVG